MIFAIELYTIGLLIYFLFFVVSLISKIADILDIKVFSITPPKDEEKPLD